MIIAFGQILSGLLMLIGSIALCLCVAASFFAKKYKYEGKFTDEFILAEYDRMGSLTRPLTKYEVNYYDALQELEATRARGD